MCPERGGEDAEELDSREERLREEIPDPDGEIEKLRAEVQSLRSEVQRLKEKCNMQSKILQSLTPDKHPGVLFITGHLGTKDKNGFPDKLLICPSYGVDWAEVYTREGTVWGPQW